MAFNISNGESGASVRTKLNAKLSPVIDVMADFGAAGDGSTDDTNAIQAALDAGAAGGYPVFFPVKFYKVTSPKTTTVTGCTSSSGHCLLNVASTTGFATGDMAYCRGVIGVPNVNASYGIDVISAGTPGTILLRDSAFSGAYVSGGTLTLPCLKVKQAGNRIFSHGAVLTPSTTNCAVLTLDGYNGYINDITFNGGGVAGTIGLDYNWCQRDGDAVSSQTVGLYDCRFYGSDYGLAIGMGQAMCSETTIQNCFFSARTGFYNGNQNALSQSVKGGNFSGCKDYGIYVPAGDVPVIQGVGFQNYPEAVLAGYGYVTSGVMTITAMSTQRHPGYGFEVGDLIKCQTDPTGIPLNTRITAITSGTGFDGTYTLSNSFTFSSSGASPAKVLGVAGKADIYIPNGQGDSIIIEGCRSESHNFAWLPYAQPYALIGNAHVGGDANQGDAFFYHGAAKVKISACSSGCWINPSSGSLEIDSACNFTGTDYWRHTEGADPNDPAFVSITPQPIIFDTSTARSTIGMDNSCLIQFSSASAITYTLTKTDGSATRMRPGSWIDIQRTGTGSLTIAGASGVTVHAPTTQGSITARARYSKVRVMVDAENVYSVSGDITP